MIFSYNNDEEVLNDKSMQWRQHNTTWFDTHHFGSVSFDIDHLGPFAKWTVGTDPHTKTRSFNSLLLDYLESEPLSSLLSTGIYVLLITSVDSKQALRSTDICTRWAENPVSESAQISLIEFFRFIYMQRNLRWI